MADIIGREMGLSGVGGKNRQSHLSIILEIFFGRFAHLLETFSCHVVMEPFFLAVLITTFTGLEETIVGCL